MAICNSSKVNNHEIGRATHAPWYENIKDCATNGALGNDKVKFIKRLLHFEKLIFSFVATIEAKILHAPLYVMRIDFKSMISMLRT